MVAVEVVQGAAGASGVGSDVGLLEGLLLGCWVLVLEEEEEEKRRVERKRKKKKKSPTFFPLFRARPSDDRRCLSLSCLSVSPPRQKGSNQLIARQTGHKANALEVPNKRKRAISKQRSSSGDATEQH